MAEDSVQEDDIKVETTSKEHDSLVTLELKIILPDRENLSLLLSQHKLYPPVVGLGDFLSIISFTV